MHSIGKRMVGTLVMVGFAAGTAMAFVGCGGAGSDDDCWQCAASSGHPLKDGVLRTGCIDEKTAEEFSSYGYNCAKIS